MEKKIELMAKSIEDLKRQVQTIQAKIESQSLILHQIAKDVGTGDAKVLTDVIYKMDGYMSRDVGDVQTMLREVAETRRMTTNVELLVKEMMRGLSVIYNNVDELEANLLPEKLT